MVFGDRDVDEADVTNVCEVVKVPTKVELVAKSTPYKVASGLPFWLQDTVTLDIPEFPARDAGTLA